MLSKNTFYFGVENIFCRRQFLGCSQRQLIARQLAPTDSDIPSKRVKMFDIKLTKLVCQGRDFVVDNYYKVWYNVYNYARRGVKWFIMELLWLKLCILLGVCTFYIVNTFVFLLGFTSPQLFDIRLIVDEGRSQMSICPYVSTNHPGRTTDLPQVSRKSSPHENLTVHNRHLSTKVMMSTLHILPPLRVFLLTGAYSLNQRQISLR